MVIVAGFIDDVSSKSYLTISTQQPIIDIMTHCGEKISNNDFEYVGFWKRALAALIDALIGFVLLPITIPLMKFSFAHRTIVPSLTFSVIWIAFWLWLIVRFGATPGKMVINARIINCNGEFLSWGRALLRMLFPTLLLLINSYLRQWMTMNTAPDGTSFGSFMDIGRASNQYSQPLGMITTFLTLTIYIDVLVVACNKRKRAIHDFIAGSYVVTKDSINIKASTKTCYAKNDVVN
jgi:uncharacterized RDD family membrane protein YckC